MARQKQKYLKVTWTVSDGYCNGNAPHYSLIPLEELEGLDEAERRQCIEEYVFEDFQEKVSFSVGESEEVEQ